ncbi:MAG: formate hydrogenlyase subunit 4 [Microbacterium sp.]|nr:formate hydrogenlyase subunit 4 [Microbacterium sp.]
MNFSTTLVSVGIAVAAMTIVTLSVSAGIRRSPSNATYRATKENVLFVVSTRRWQRVLIRTVGITAIALGAIIALASSTPPPSPTMGVAGIATVVGGILFVLLARGMHRLRLEVTPDTIWSFPMVAAPREIPLAEITALAPHITSNYGGILGKTGSKTRFYATGIMLGYPQLIEHFRQYRPDLPIPEASRPLQER